MLKKTFHKNERLKSHKAIEALFKKGQSFGQYPLRLVYTPWESHNHKYPIQISVSVPKKKFPKAVHRNRIRRQIKDAWRLNKNWLYKRLPPESPAAAMMIIYVAKEPLPYEEIERSVRIMTRRFLKKWKQQQTTERI